VARWKLIEKNRKFVAGRIKSLADDIKISKPEKKGKQLKCWLLKNEGSGTKFI